MIARHALAGDPRLRAMGLIDTEQPHGLSWRFKSFLAGAPPARLRRRRSAGSPGGRGCAATRSCSAARSPTGRCSTASSTSSSSGRSTRRRRTATPPIRLLRSFDDQLRPRPRPSCTAGSTSRCSSSGASRTRSSPSRGRRRWWPTFPDARLEVIEGAGLFSHEERPAEVARALLPHAHRRRRQPSCSVRSRRPCTVSSMSSKHGPGLPPTRIPQINSRALAATSESAVCAAVQPRHRPRACCCRAARPRVAVADRAQHGDQLVVGGGRGGGAGVVMIRRASAPAWPSSRPASPSGTCRTSSTGAGVAICRPCGPHLVGGSGRPAVTQAWTWASLSTTAPAGRIGYRCGEPTVSARSSTASAMRPHSSRISGSGGAGGHGERVVRRRTDVEQAVVGGGVDEVDDVQVVGERLGPVLVRVGPARRR